MIKIGGKMIPVQVRISKRMIEKIDELVSYGIYSNRSEVIRDATRRLIIEMISKKDIRRGVYNGS